MKLFTRQPALNAHSWLGVFLGVFLYLLCLSGTLVVFNQEFERWEQPNIEEFERVSPEAIDTAMARFLAKHPEETEHYHVVLPGSGIPRLVVENDHNAWFADAQGNLLEQERFPWSKMLVKLHYYLHLPMTWGLIFVSAMGAVICALVVSGIFAHKRLVKDAFKLRRGGTVQPGRIDLHNRFGIWAAPFHLIIGITGTYFGIAGVILTLVAQIDYNGDRQAVMDKVFTPEPQLEQTVSTPQIGTALANFEQMNTGHVPLFITVHDVGTPAQFIELYGQMPGKMAYSENYRFDSSGAFLATAGYADGYWGKQLIYSMYRLHFGDFAGLPVKILYFVLGIMLTALCVTGVDIWLAKQANPPRLRRCWAAVVWGSISAIALSALASLWSDVSMYYSFWWLMVAGVAASIVTPYLQPARWQLISGFSSLLLVVAHLMAFTGSALNGAALAINMLLVAYALWTFWRFYQHQKVPEFAAPAAARAGSPAAPRHCAAVVSQNASQAQD